MISFLGQVYWKGCGVDEAVPFVSMCYRFFLRVSVGSQ